MSSFFYAQITTNNVVYALSQLAGEVIQANLIPITEQQYSELTLLGKTYDPVLKTFS